ncbi:hypothetical protein F5X99DRAFT_427401 [Biscogniauxia marginata]|nr:hypothetical protein F5X99DRAFT_427401 [Biscogniauxia marginata]
MGTPSKTADKKAKQSCPSPTPTPTPTPTTHNHNTHQLPPRRSPSQPPSRPPSQARERITTDPTYQRPGPGFPHQVTNLPGGLFDTRDSLRQPQPPPQFFPVPGFPAQANPSIPSTTYPLLFTASTQLPTMATVGSGVMPNAQAQHFQPQVPDTTHGPYVHTYYPRHDGMPNGAPVQNGPPMFQAMGGPVPIQQVATIPQTQPLVGFQIVQYFVPQPTTIFQGTAPPQMIYYLVNNASQLQSPAPKPGATDARPSALPSSDEHVQGGMATAPIPMMAPGQPQPVYIQGQPMSFANQPPQMMAHPGHVMSQPGTVPAMAYPQACGGGGPTMIPGNGPPGAQFPPDIMGIGKTAMEVQAEQALAAESNQALEPQDMKPADDDVSRMYYCREPDGVWLQRNRYSIDKMGCFRWYVWPNGVFYAVRLAD